MKLSKFIEQLNNYDPNIEIGMLNDGRENSFDGDMLIDWVEINENKTVNFPNPKIFDDNDKFKTGAIVLSIF